MPKFILNKPERKHGYDSLPDFCKSYVEAMFFTNGDIGDERENLLNEWGVEKLTRESIENIRRDCEKFLAFEHNGVTVQQLLEQHPDDSTRTAAHDFWFTRQGHGVGFWEREWPEEVGAILCKAAKAQGESYVEAWRGWIHVK